MSLVGGGRHQSWWRPGRITSWLTDDDRCYCLGEYTARQGYSYSPTNNLTLGAMPAKGPSISRSTGCGNQPAQRVNMQLEDLQPRCAVRGVHPDGLVTVVSVQWFGSEALELTYKTPAGTVADELL